MFRNHEFCFSNTKPHRSFVLPFDHPETHFRIHPQTFLLLLILRSFPRYSFLTLHRYATRVRLKSPIATRQLVS